MDQTQIKKITELVSRLNSGVIALQNNPSIDGIASGTALYLALSKMGKHMSIVCSSKPQADLVGIDKVQNVFAASGNHLVISFPYTEGAIDKVDYNISGNSFNLILVPTGETNKIDPKDVKFSYTGGKIDFIITVDVPNLNSLGPLYTENQNEFQGKNIVNIDRHLINNNFGTVNVVNKSISSTSEIVYHVIRDMGVEIDKDIATNLYNGILSATNNFTSYSVNQATFEASAELMKIGAVKKQFAQPKPPGAFGAAPGFGGGFGAQPGFSGQQGGFGAPGGFGGQQGGFTPPGGFGGQPNPMGGQQQQSPFGGFGGQAPMNRPMSGMPPMAPPPMDDFDDFDDFDDLPSIPAPMPFGQPQQQPQINRPPQQPPMQQFPNPMMQQAPQQQMQQQPQQFNQQPMQPQQPQQNQAPQQNPNQQNQSNQPMQQQQQQQQQPQQNQQNNQQGGQQKSPQDWLKPKLFRGNNLI